MKYFVTILILALVACQPASKKKTEVLKSEAPSYKLELVWESDTLVRTPESVLIDRQNDILYVSNINNGPWEKDGNGFISKMDRSGKITELHWIDGLNAPKGMGISGNSLFIADIDELVEANLNTGKIVNRFPVDGDPQLNDVTVSDDGTVYVSGSGSNKIYRLENGKLTPVFEGEEGERFNGLLWEKDRMLLVTSGSSRFMEIPRETMQGKVISENMGHGDAICAVGDGGYITTDWSGTVFYVSPEGGKTKLLDTTTEGENAADAAFDPDLQILYVPTFFKNRVKAYRLVKN